MEKTFKYFCFVMTAIIVISSIMMPFTLSQTGDGPKLDPFSCTDIVENIKNLELNMTSIIYVQNNNGEWKEYQRLHGEENRIWVSMDKVPQNIINAFIAIEDQHFYSHKGVDWKRTAGAFLNWLPFFNIYSSKQGGSTITQQLIKNITSDNDKSATRKLREIARALIIEKLVDKDTILEAYLNTISLGNGICGVQVAANYYFNKDVSELSLVECASIASITQNPSAYNPDKNPHDNKVRRQTVLKLILEQGLISEEEFNDSYDADIVIDKTQQSSFEIPVNSYFVDALIDDVISKLSEKYGCSADTASSMFYNGGYKIYATVNPKIQETAEKVYLNNKYFSQISKKDKTKHVQSAITIMDYEGHILGIVGGAGEKTVNRGLNRATESPQQPGSTMKPLGAYALAIDKGIVTYSSIVDDKPLDNFYDNGKKGPKEWYGYYAGRMTLQKALERSANTIPCQLVKELGVDVSYDFLTQSLGMKFLTPEDKNLSSLALGGTHTGITTTESAAAYAIFGNGGKYFEPTTYYKVEKATGEIELQSDTVGKQVIHPATASIMNMLLQNVVYGSQGTGGSIGGYNKMRAYAKTGTSSDNYDRWMVAGTPYYVASVWYGFDKNEKVNSSGAATIWKTIMSQVHKGLEYKEFEMSDQVITAKYCRYTGLLAGSKCYSKADGYYVPDIQAEICLGKHTSVPEDTHSESEVSSSSSSSEISNSTNSETTTSSETQTSDDSSTVSTSSEETITKPNETSSNDLQSSLSEVSESSNTSSADSE